MKRTVITYGVLGGALIAALKIIEYRFLVLEHSLEIYGGIVALLFSLLGIWLGLKLTRTRETVVVREVPVRVEVEVRVPVAGPFVRDEARLEQIFGADYLQPSKDPLLPWKSRGRVVPRVEVGRVVVQRASWWFPAEELPRRRTGHPLLAVTGR